MKIALYPGSFNPIHEGHIQLARHLVRQGLADEVWMVVSPHNPLKEATALADEHHREQMACLATQGINGLVVSTIEFSLPRPSYTIDTVKALQVSYPEYVFSLMIGSDNALVFNQWKAYVQLLDTIEVYVYPRRGFPLEEVLQLYPQMHVLDTPFYDISSSQLRHLLAAGHDTGEWLHPSVVRYIKDNKLY
jgi:nicotinate-nucleotide adenylyltransferase